MFETLTFHAIHQWVDGTWVMHFHDGGAYGTYIASDPPHILHPSPLFDLDYNAVLAPAAWDCLTGVEAPNA